MTPELFCRLPADPGSVDPAVLLGFCADLSQRLQAKLLLNQAPEFQRHSQGRTIYAVDVFVTSASALKISYAFGSAQAWQKGEEMRYDDLGFDVMDAGITDTTIGALADTLMNLSRLKE